MAINSPPSLRSRSSLLAPQHTTPIYVNDLRGYSMFRAVVRDSFPTRIIHVVVITDAETSGGQPSPRKPLRYASPRKCLPTRMMDRELSHYPLQDRHFR
jgi:hypothetical protein